VLDRNGATIGLRSDTASTSVYGSISGSVPADSFRRRRIRISADIEAKNAVGGASAWLRIDGPSGSLALDNGSNNAVEGTSSGHREITLYVPAAATRIVFGLILSGPGEATAKGLRLDSQPMSDVNAPLAPAAHQMLDSAYVAVLTGPCTASSGEAVTISFRGRPRTRSFGLPTAGLSTANQGFMLPDGSMIQLTVSVEADRTGRRYGEKIDPDEVIPEGAPGTDVQLDRAKAWLKSQPSCKR
jgi:hypothetical protein